MGRVSPVVNDESRRTALLSWELGSGLGHARRLLATARALQRRGWTPVVAARELWRCAAEYAHAGIPLIQAPLHRGLGAEEASRFRACSFADIMAACGYRRADDLSSIVSAWDYVIDIVKPLIVVADYSPILALAAYQRVPVIAIGDGFVLPPPHLPCMPLLRDRGTEAADEQQLLANAAAVQHRRGRAIPQRLPALIGGEAHIVCTYPEIDIYRNYRLTLASGPVIRIPPRLERPEKPAIFAYLAADFRPSLKLLEVLINSRYPLEVFLRDSSDRLRRALRARGAQVHDIAPSLADVAQRASLVVHHAGIGTVEDCLALGRPQLLLPRHLEQSLNAANLKRLGIGVILSPSFSLAEGSRLVDEATSSGRLSERARDFAAGLVGRKSDSIDRIVAHCEGLAGAA